MSWSAGAGSSISVETLARIDARTTSCVAFALSRIVGSFRGSISVSASGIALLALRSVH